MAELYIAFVENLIRQVINAATSIYKYHHDTDCPYDKAEYGIAIIREELERVIVSVLFVEYARGNAEFEECAASLQHVPDSNVSAFPCSTLLSTEHVSCSALDR